MPVVGDMLASTYDPVGVNEQLVGVTAVQSLTNKTVAATIPMATYGSDLQPAMSTWTLSGTASYQTSPVQVNPGTGAGSITFPVTVTSGDKILVTVPNDTENGSGLTGGHFQVAIGAVTDGPYLQQYDNDRQVTVAATGSLNFVMSWTSALSGPVTAIHVRKVTATPTPSLVADAAQVRSDNTTKNLAIGVNGHAQRTTGVANTAFGQQAQRNLTTGTDNTAVGEHAQASLTMGNDNVAIGQSAQQNLTTGTQNTAIGTGSQFALTQGNFNVTLGSYSQVNLTSGANNVVVGAQSQSAITTGNYNIATGTNTQNAMTTAESNVAIGDAAQSGISTGSNNTAVGDSAQGSPLWTNAYASTTANGQTSVGAASGQNTSTPLNGITTIGYQATAGAALATSLGYQSRADHGHSVAVGDSTQTTAASQVEIGSRHLEFTEQSAPGAGSANSVRGSVNLTV